MNNEITMTKTTKRRRNTIQKSALGLTTQPRPRAAAVKNVKNGPSQRRKKQALPSAAKLSRTTFRTSREMDFFSEKELVTQTGHSTDEWPLVIVKELIDNALDACEEADIAPVIEVTADACGISVRDNGLGLPEATLKAAMDFTVRASNREAYVAPDRGAQGNALKTIIPMPWVIDPQHGRLIITAHGQQHVITCGADPISQRAVVNDEVNPLKKCKNLQPEHRKRKQALSGTAVRLEWSPCSDDGEVIWPFAELFPLADSGWYAQPSYSERFRAIIEGFALFNPHAAFRLDWFGAESNWPATNPQWDKWRPNKPTSAHWYEPAHLERLLGAYITHDRDEGTDRHVSDFVAEFDGLSGSQKRAKVLDETGLKRAKLSDLVLGGRLDSRRIRQLLSSMQRHARPIKAKRLGMIGEEHLRARLLQMGVAPDSFRYSRKLSQQGLPYVIESAFGWRGGESQEPRVISTGANWSAAIKNPFRSFGATGEGLEAVLAELKAGRSEPIVFVLHLAHPRIEYTDRGKSALVVAHGESKL